MKARVLKFGGTSVATSEAREAAVKQVATAISEGVRPVVVVSAIGRKGMPYATDTLIATLQEIDPTTQPAGRELDLLMACGEILSAVVFGHYLNSLGLRSVVLTGAQAGIITDNYYGDARIRSVDPAAIQSAIERGLVPVVCGFQGVAQGTAETTTLGRGGSDTTAAAIGVALKAELIDIFTDVAGVLSADPRVVPEATLLPSITFAEVAELAHLGAKVLHPRAAEIAMRGGVPMRVRSTFSQSEGTLVAPSADAGRGITGVTASSRMSYVQIHGISAKAQANVFQVLSRASVPVSALSLTPESMAFTVPYEEFGQVRTALDGLVLGDGMTILSLGEQGSNSRAKLQQVALGASARLLIAAIVENCAVVSVLGGKHHQRPGVFLALLNALNNLGIRPIQTADSEFSVGVLVDGADVERVVRGLHAEFAEDI